MHFKSLFFSLLLLGFGANAQTTDSLIIEGNWRHGPTYPYLLLQRMGAQEALVAQASIKDEHFRFALPPDMPKGIYRFIYDPIEHKFFDVVLDGQKHLRFTADLEPTLQLSFDNSPENTAWYNYQQQSLRQTLKLQLLGSLLANYPDPQKSIVKQAISEFEQEKKALIKLRDGFIAQNSRSLSAKMTAAVPLRFGKPTDHPRVQAYLAQQSFWDGVDLQSPQLLQTPLYADLIVAYLKYYMSSSSVKWSETDRDEGIIKCIDSMMVRFAHNPPLKQYAIDLMSSAFKQTGDEKPLQYLDEKIRGTETCANDHQADSEFQQRLAAYKALKVGMPAPEITLTNPQTNEKFGLKDISEERVLLVFWASTCEHCQKHLPRLQQDNLLQRGVAVVAISLDTDPDAYHKATEPLTNMFHVCDFKAWDSPPTKDYHIVATPSFILLDKKRNIIGKYASYDSVKEMLVAQ